MILARHLLTKMRLDDPFLCWTPFPWPDPYTNRPSMVQMDQWIDGIPLSHFFLLSLLSLCCLSSPLLLYPYTLSYHITRHTRTLFRKSTHLSL